MNLITGKKGFIGRHLALSLAKRKKNFFNIDLKKNTNKLYKYPKLIIFLLSFVNKGNNLFNKNNLIYLRFIKFLKIQKNIKEIYFSNSIHVKEKNNEYTNSKNFFSKKLSNYCKKEKIKFYNLILPNIYGEYGRPNYNSVVSTICNNIIKKNKLTKVSKKKVKYYYIDDVVRKFFLKKNISIKSMNISSKSLEKKMDLIWKEFNTKNLIPKNINDLRLFSCLLSATNSFIIKNNLKYALNKKTNKNNFFTIFILFGNFKVSIINKFNNEFQKKNINTFRKKVYFLIPKYFELKILKVKSKSYFKKIYIYI